MFSLKKAIGEELAGSDGAGFEVSHGDCPCSRSLLLVGRDEQNGDPAAITVVEDDLWYWVERNRQVPASMQVINTERSVTTPTVTRFKILITAQLVLAY